MAAPVTLQLEQTVDVETPELVVLTYSIAGIGSRVVAALVDLLICFATMAVLAIATVVLEVPMRIGNGPFGRGGIVRRQLEIAADVLAPNGGLAGDQVVGGALGR